MANKLEERFWLIASQKAENHKLKYSEDCETYLREMISQGVGQIKMQRAENDEEQLRKAEQNLHIFIDKMIDEADKKKSNILYEATFYAAKKSLCPIWPFC